MKSFVSLAGVVAFLSVSAPSHAALTFNLSYDATVASQFGANTANFQAAATTAAANFTSLFNDNIHINIRIVADSTGSILGQSSQNIFNVSYASLRGAVVADAKSTDDNTAIGAGGSVVVADPNAGGNWWLTSAQRKALGLAADNAVTSDGTCTFGSTFSYDYDPSNGVTGGQIDLVGVMMHEFSEIMGRIGIAGGVITSGPGETLYDNFSYSGAGTKALGNPVGNYFSIDGGTTNLKVFNSGGGGDSRDWASGSNDSFNAFSSSGVVNGLTSPGIRSMDVIGYDLISVTTSAPEPGTLALVALGGFGGLFLKRRNRTA